MTKKKWFIFILIFITIILLAIWIWGHNHKIIEGQYDKLTITKMGNILYRIENKEKIDRIINQINANSRTFNPNNGFRYDHLRHGTLIFESQNEKMELEIVFPKGNVLTKYWEIETNFEFTDYLE